MKLQTASGLFFFGSLFPTLLLASQGPVISDKDRGTALIHLSWPRISDLASSIKATESQAQITVNCTLASFIIGAFCSKYTSYFRLSLSTTHFRPQRVLLIVVLHLFHSTFCVLSPRLGFKGARTLHVFARGIIPFFRSDSASTLSPVMKFYRR